MKKSSLLIALITASFMVQAQKYRTIELKPITQQGWKYFYDLKKVTSPVALEVPLMSLNDNEVNRYFKKSKAWRDVGAIVTIVPLVYFLTLPNNTQINETTFWVIVGSTIAVQIGCEAISHLHLGKAIDRYNYIIMQPSGNSLGVKLTWKFR